MTYSIVDKFVRRENTQRHSSYHITDSYTYVVNALRRTMLSELTCAGIPNTYSTLKNNVYTPGLQMHQNTGRLHNEFLAHRLSLIPIGLSPIAMQTHQFVMTLKKACLATQDTPVPITSDDIELYIIKNGDRERVANVQQYTIGGCSLIPTDPIVSDTLKVTIKKGILITRLYPDEALHIDMFPTVGRTCDYAGFSPLYTCTYEQEKQPGKHTSNFHFLVDGLGSHSCDSLLQQGWYNLKQKVEVLQLLMQPRTVELHFGHTAPALESAVSNQNRKCWVRWSNVDFLTSSNQTANFYHKHCREVLASTTEDDSIITTTPYSKHTTVPAVDGEDIHTSSEKTKLVLAMHQPTFHENGIFEYDVSSRQYTLVDEPETTFCILKEGCTQRALVYTPATLVHVHNSRCVLQFDPSVPDAVFDHLIDHIDGVVFAGAADGEPPIHFAKPTVARDAIQIRNDGNTGYTLVVDEEDHTLGNLVQGYIYDNLLRTDQKRQDPNKEHLIALGYNKPIPSEKKIHFRFEFDKEIEPNQFIAFFAKHLSNLQKQIENVQTTLG
jgi:DNA-directed RNA polymerase subunit L